MLPAAGAGGQGASEMAVQQHRCQDMNYVERRYVVKLDPEDYWMLLRETGVTASGGVGSAAVLVAAPGLGGLASAVPGLRTAPHPELPAPRVGRGARPLGTNAYRNDGVLHR